VFVGLVQFGGRGLNYRDGLISSKWTARNCPFSRSARNSGNASIAEPFLQPGRARWGASGAL
jgi:hypothetical protein